MKSKTVIGMLVLAIVVVASVIIGFQYGGVKLTMLSASTINIDPGGYLSGTNLKGTYWDIGMLVDFTDQVDTYQFDDTQAHSAQSSPYFDGQNVTVKNTITIKITPSRPYIERPMKLTITTVVPGACQNWATLVASGRDSSIGVVNDYKPMRWETTTSDWILHTPFTIEAFVNGVSRGAKYIDSVGTTTTTVISAGQSEHWGTGVDDSIYVQDLGKIGSGYTMPNWYSLEWFSKQYFFYRDSGVIHALTNPYPIGDGSSASVGWMTGSYENTFAYYWYGMGGTSTDYTGYWKDTGQPFPCTSDKGDGAGFVISYTQNSGWMDGGGDIGIWWRRIPFSSGPPTFPTEAKPSGKSISVHSLVEYLQQDIGASVPSPPSWDPNLDNLGFTVDPSDSSLGWLRDYLPWGSYSSNINILISTALADTVVWQPQLGNFKITSCPSDIGSVGDKKTVSITVQQTADVTASGTVTLMPITQGLTWSILPPAWATAPLSQGQLQTFNFVVENLGQPVDADFKIRVDAANSLGTITDTKEITGKLLAYSVTGSVLVVKTIDINTKIAISGIHVIVNWETQGVNGWTANGLVSFDFKGATPSVTIATEQNSLYKSASTVVQMHTGETDVTLELVPLGQVPPQDWTWLVLVVLITVVIAVVAVIMTKRKRRR